MADFRKRVKEISKIKTTQIPVNFESLLYVLMVVPIRLQFLLFNYLYWDLKLKSALLALQKKSVNFLIFVKINSQINTDIRYKLTNES